METTLAQKEVFVPSDSFLIACGSELVRGEVQDCNSPWLARALLALGCAPREIRLVPDDDEAILRALADARDAGVAVTICAGGLGPTDDDRVREAVARFANAPLEVHEELERRLRTFLRERGRTASAGNLRQALLPRGAKPLRNPLGTAAGFHLDAGSMRVVCLPGPPAELEATAGEDLSALASVLPGPTHVEVVRLDTFGLPEAEVDERLGAVRRLEGVKVGTLADLGMVAVILSARGENAATRVAEARAEARTRLGEAVYGEGGKTVAEVTAERLREGHLTLAAAESCTGGLVGHLLTEVPGVSGVFLGGVVAYANETKIARLGVDPAVLARHGAVSPETAAAMARGVAAGEGADVGVSTTGIAGPGGGTPEKPVGLVYVAVWFRGREEVRRLRLGGMNRHWVKRISAVSALDLVRRTVLDASS